MKPSISFRKAVLDASLGASLLVVASPACFASGFQILEQSTSRLGTAYAGTASIADDATTVFFNPAGMARLEEREFAGSGYIVPIDSQFSDRASRAAAGTPLARPLFGPGGTTDTPGLTGNLYFVQPLFDRWTFGFGVTMPFGLISEFDDDSRVRYHATDSELTVINLNPTVAFEVTETLSLGFGVSYQHADAKLENAVNSFAVCTSAGGSAAQCEARHAGPLSDGVANRDADSQATIDVDDEAFVVDLSLHWQPTERTAVGLIWRQGADYDLSGDASFDVSDSCQADPFCSGSLQLLEGSVRADAELPDTVTASVSHRFGERWHVHGDVAWTEWSSLQRVGVVNRDNGAEVNALNLNYDDTFRVAGGASYAVSDYLTWRFGVAFDETPQDDPAFVTPRIPDEDRIWVSAGFNYRFTENASIDVGLAHLFMDDAGIDSTEQGVRLTGEFDNTVNVFGVQFNWRL